MHQHLAHCSSMASLYRSLLLIIAGSTQRELARQVRYLKVENDILRSKLPARLTITPKERQRLLKFGAKLGKAMRQLVTIKSERCIPGVLPFCAAMGCGEVGATGAGARRSIPTVKGAVAGLLHVVQTLAEIDHVLVSTAAFDDRMGQVAGQPVKINGAEGDRLDIVAGGAGSLVDLAPGE